MRYWFYRTLMRLAHRFNWHHMKPCYPDGDTMLWCRWCGIRVVIKQSNKTLELKNENTNSIFS
jgi:hypothetical protein